MGELEDALAEAEREEREERAALAEVKATPVPVIQTAEEAVPVMPPPVELTPPKSISLMTDDERAFAFVDAVHAFLRATSVRRADRSYFDDRCIACERRGVHRPGFIHCNCPCHPLRALLQG